MTQETVGILCRETGAAVLVAAGVAVIVWSARGLARDLRDRPKDPQRALAILRRFRGAIVGLGLCGALAGWFWEIDWLLGLAVIIGAEELLESSVGILALKHDARNAGP